MRIMCPRRCCFLLSLLRPAILGLTVVVASEVGLVPSAQGTPAASLREIFLNPPDEAKPRGYWVWPHGLLLCSEAGGPGAPLHDVPTEELKALGAVDVMRGEFWHGKTGQLTPDGFEELHQHRPDLVGTVRPASCLPRAVQRVVDAG